MSSVTRYRQTVHIKIEIIHWLSIHLVRYAFLTLKKFKNKMFIYLLYQMVCNSLNVNESHI